MKPLLNEYCRLRQCSNSFFFKLLFVLIQLFSSYEIKVINCCIQFSTLAISNSIPLTLCNHLYAFYFSLFVFQNLFSSIGYGLLCRHILGRSGRSIILFLSTFVHCQSSSFYPFQNILVYYSFSLILRIFLKHRIFQQPLVLCSLFCRLPEFHRLYTLEGFSSFHYNVHTFNSNQ